MCVAALAVLAASLVCAIVGIIVGHSQVFEAGRTLGRSARFALGGGLGGTALALVVLANYGCN